MPDRLDCLGEIGSYHGLGRGLKSAGRDGRTIANKRRGLMGKACAGVLLVGGRPREAPTPRIGEVEQIQGNRACISMSTAPLRASLTPARSFWRRRATGPPWPPDRKRPRATRRGSGWCFCSITRNSPCRPIPSAGTAAVTNGTAADDMVVNRGNGLASPEMLHSIDPVHLAHGCDYVCAGSS